MLTHVCYCKGDIKVLCKLQWGGVSEISRKKALRRCAFKVIRVMRGGWVSNFQEKSIAYLNGPKNLFANTKVN